MANWYLNRLAAGGLNDGTSLENAWTGVGSISSSSFSNYDTLFIQGGNYTGEEVSLFFPNKTGIAFRIYSGAQQPAIFRACQFYNANNCILDGNLTGGKMLKFTGFAFVSPNYTDSIHVRETNGFFISGCEITHSGNLTGDGVAHHGIGIKGTVSSGVINNNYIHHIVTDGINLNNSSSVPPGNVYDWFTISNNNIYYLGDDGIQSAFGGITVYNNYVDQGGSPLFLGAHPDGIQINPNQNSVKIYNNTFVGFNQSMFVEFASGNGDIQLYNNQLIGIWPDPTNLNTARALNYSVRASYSGTFLFSNNVCYNFRSFFACNGGIGTGDTFGVFKNNIFLNCKFAMSDPTGGSYLDSSNLFYNDSGIQFYDTSGSPVGVPSNQHAGLSTTGNPLFIDTSGYDFHLQAGSLAIGAGTNLSSYFSIDKSGIIRTNPWDIGVYQYFLASGGSYIAISRMGRRPKFRAFHRF